MNSKISTENPISSLLGEHYSRTFQEHGATPEGVDWGPDPADHQLRLERMLAVLDIGKAAGTRPTLLDVGCGYGSLLDHIKKKKLSLEYCGIDICESMISSAIHRHADSRWFVGDILKMDGMRRFDYVVCNGVLTQKLEASILDMNQFLHSVVTRMFELCRVGIAFNVMTTHVNFISPNLYYRNPTELIGWCMSALTTQVRLDHAYPMYEYTIYLYRHDAPGLVYGSHRNFGRT